MDWYLSKGYSDISLSPICRSLCRIRSFFPPHILPDPMDHYQIYYRTAEQVLTSMKNDCGEKKTMTRALDYYVNMFREQEVAHWPACYEDISTHFGEMLMQPVVDIRIDLSCAIATATEKIMFHPLLRLNGHYIKQMLGVARSQTGSFIETIRYHAGQLKRVRERMYELDEHYHTNLMIDMHSGCHDFVNIMSALFAMTSVLEKNLEQCPCGDEHPVACDEILDAMRTQFVQSENPIRFINKTFGNRAYRNGKQACRVNAVSDIDEAELPNRVELLQTLYHLVQNAIKSGASDVSIKAEGYRQDRVRITVSDDCPNGLPSDVQHLMGVQPLRKPGSMEGGMGLYLVLNKYRRALSAEITWRSPLRNGNGTRFCIILPRSLHV